MKYIISDIDGVLMTDDATREQPEIINALLKDKPDQVIIVTNRKREANEITKEQLKNIVKKYKLPITKIYSLTKYNYGDKVGRIKYIIKKYGKPMYFIENDPNILKEVKKHIPDLTLYYVSPYLQILKYK